MMSDLIYPANPAPYVKGSQLGHGYLLTKGGMTQTDFVITSCTLASGKRLCACVIGLGVLDEAPAYRTQTQEGIYQEIVYYKAGESVTEDVLVDNQGYMPLRTLYISDVIGRDIPGGKTIYAIDIVSDCTDRVYIGISSLRNPKDGMTFRKWQQVYYPHSRVRPIVSGQEFRIHVYTKGAGRFNILSLTAWLKVTDLRGFNTSPQGASNAS
jgi:hypothetical protein